MTKCLTVGLFTVAGLMMALSLPARAADHAFISTAVNLRAGPSPDYPPLTVLRARTPVIVHGCLREWSWCDVSYGPDRGWIDASYLDEDYGGRRAPVAGYGVRFGIAILTFNIADYWGNHYRNRPWYGRRDEYRARIEHRAPPPRERRREDISHRGSYEHGEGRRKEDHRRPQHDSHEHEQSGSRGSGYGNRNEPLYQQRQHDRQSRNYQQNQRGRDHGDDQHR